MAFENCEPTEIDHFVPDTIEEIQALKKIVTKPKEHFGNGLLGILFHGAHGTGKTTLGKLLPKLIENELPPDFETATIHCSTETQKSILDFAEVGGSSMYGAYHQYLLFDEIDRRTPKEQGAIASFMDRRSRRATFMFTTNNFSKVHPSVRDRCHTVSFEKPSTDLWKARIKTLIEAEGLQNKFTDSDIDAIIAKANGSARKVITALRLHID